MNDTEQLAFNYLREQGYKNIVFHSNSTPDFTTNTKSFEVKPTYGNTIIFYKPQADYLNTNQDTVILIYRDNSTIPLAVTYQELITSKIYNISVLENGRDKYTSVRMKKSTCELLHLYGLKYGVYRDSLDSIILKLILAVAPELKDNAH